MSPEQPELPDFQQTQFAFTAWLRQPEQKPLPVGVEPRRMAMYRELLFGNVMTFVEGTFPITNALLPSALMQRLKETFFADFHCTSPFFYDISLHFREFVAGLDWPELAAYPWLTELLHFEWMELAAEISEDDPAPAHQPLSATDFPLDTQVRLRLACPVWPLVYQWPLNDWTIDTTLEAIAGLMPSPQCILFFRPIGHSLLRLEITPVAAYLIDLLTPQASISSLGKSAEPNMTTVAALSKQLMQAIPDMSLAAAQQLTQEVLSHIIEHGIVISR